jgi:phosphoribosyl 1,2-cyclic phosphate phosphodiesterase
MPDTLRLTILGCGSSPGTPRIGNNWGACDPNNPRNRRRRCSLLVERVNAQGQVTRVLVDTSPDLRAQALDADFGRIDAVLYTHAHADHIHGIDDLRGFVLNMRRRIDIYADAQTLARLREGFGYCFETPEGSDYPPILEAHEIAAGENVVVNGAAGPLEALPIIQMHGRITTLAFRFGGVAYSPDVSDFDHAAEYALKDLDVWIVDALRYTTHPSHLSVDQAVAWIERFGAKHAVLTHMHGDLDYETLRRSLPKHVEPAYDGMQIEVPYRAEDAG